MSYKTALKNFMRKRIPLITISEDLETEINFNDFDGQTSDNDSTKWTQLEELKTEIKNLLEHHSGGIWCSDLIWLYRIRYDRDPNITRYGFTSAKSLASELQDVLYISQPEGFTDWKLFAISTDSTATNPPLASRPVISSLRKKPFTPVDPEDVLPGVPYDPEVFPADCMQLLESIPCLKLSDEKNMEVKVGEVYSPSHFWLMRLGDAYHIASDKIFDEMNDYYRHGEGRERVMCYGALQVGHYCASSYESHWYRAVIVKLLDYDTVKVRYIDYGTVEQCGMASLRPLLRRWGALPQQAIRARLANVQPPCGGHRWPRASAAHLLHQITNRRFVANIVSRSSDAVLEVLLIDTSTKEDVLINIELVRSGHADARYDRCFESFDSYLYPRFEALECGDTPNSAEIYAYMRDGIELDYVEDYRRHVPSLYDPPSSLTSQDLPFPCPVTVQTPLSPRPMTSRDPPLPLSPRTVTLSALDCEVYCMLRHLDPNLGHRFVNEAIGRSAALLVSSSHNPESKKVRMVSAETQTEPSVRQMTSSNRLSRRRRSI